MRYLLFSLFSRNIDCHQTPKNASLTKHPLLAWPHETIFCQHFLLHYNELHTILFYVTFYIHLALAPPWDGSIDSRSKARSVSGVNVNSMRSGQKKYPCVRQQLWLQKPYLAPGSHKKIVLFRAGCKMLLMSFKFWFQKSRSSSVMLLLFSWKSVLSQKQRWFIAAEESSQVSPGSCKHFQKEDLDCS